MCIHGMVEGGLQNTGFIEPYLAYRAIDECAELGVYSIKFNFRGEPLLHENIVDFVRYGKQKGILEVQFNTNGLPANHEKIEALVLSGLDRIIFSIDGANKESYEKIRIKGNYDKLLGNIAKFIELRKIHKQTRPFIRVQMVRSKDEELEAEQFVEYWSKKGVDDIVLIDKQKRDSSGNPLKDGKPAIGRAFCAQPWQRLNINRDGKVLMCCADWDRLSVVGDFNNQSIKEIWNSPKLIKYRQMIKEDRMDEITACKACFRPATYKWE
ncbi:MAG: SPASM domain-containing protein [Magnetococcales bacterium]|nr:SPASM domain-containing protein [Magnetococcales bacterium]